MQQQTSGYGTANPYSNDSNPYGNDGANPYGAQPSYQQQDPYQTTQPQYAQDGHTNDPLPMPNQVQYVRMAPVKSNSDFLSIVEAIKADIRTLGTQVGNVAAAHQRTLSSPDSGSSQQLESIVSQTQVLNTQIKDRIKNLEADAARDPSNTVKSTQVTQLKSSFSKQLQEFRQEEANYDRRYREQIARQYKIVNPDATDAEVQEAVSGQLLLAIIDFAVQNKADHLSNRHKPTGRTRASSRLQ